MKNIRHIKKDDLEPGAYYMGICRNTNVAIWDAKKEKFIHIRYKFGHMIDEIEHFDDVKDTRNDGFIPFEKIDIAKESNEMRDYAFKIGY